MPSVYDLKPAFQNLLRPIVVKMAASGVSANQVTLGAFGLSCLCGLLLALFPRSHGAWALVPLVLFIRMALNAIDGMLAREHAMKTPLGSFLNELCDVASDAAMYLPFAYLAGPHAGFAISLAFFAVFFAALSEFSGVCAIQAGASRRYDGPMGKSDRAVVYGALAFAQAFGLARWWWCAPAIAAVAFLSAWTAIHRIQRALEEIESSKGA
jgi:CDP-diacylglycerol--glycerol-3-phosphate 3-phosphatidyltransferase